MENKPNRLLFFDLMRIGVISAIVGVHILGWYGYSGVASNTMPFGLFFLGVGITGVSLFIFISGAVLEYSYKEIDTLNGLLRFYGKRAARIYPAYWMSLILGALIAPLYLTTPLRDLLIQAGGFMIFAGIYDGLLNPMGKFIGLIFVLYLLFPFISSSMKRYPILTLTLMAIVTFGSRYFFSFAGYGGLEVIRWLPECNLFMFGLGMVLVKYRAFPKTTHNNPVISYGANLSFYVFLISSFFWQIALVSLPLFVAAVLVSSTLLMWLDNIIQVQIAKGFRIFEKKEISITHG